VARPFILPFRALSKPERIPRRLRTGHRAGHSKNVEKWRLLRVDRDFKVSTIKQLLVSTMGKVSLRDEIFTLIYSRNRVDEAILRLNVMIKAAPENSEAIALKAYSLNKLANIRHEWKYSGHALDYAERALALNPNHDIALTSKGWALIDLGRAREAVVVLEQATRVNSGNEWAWYNLAWAQYLSGNAPASSESITTALAINPNNPILQRGKEMMGKGEVPSHLKARNLTHG